MVGKMPTNVCVNADIGGGILPTLPLTHKCGNKMAGILSTWIAVK